MPASIKAIQLLLPELILTFISSFFCFSSISYSYIINGPIRSIGMFCMFYALVQMLIFKVVWPWSKKSKVRNLLLTDSQPVTEWINGLFLSIALWLSTHTMFVLFGAPLFNVALETTASAALTALLICCPALALIGSDITKWYQVMICGKYNNNQERFVYLHSACVIFGTWISAVVVPLDWDRPWQEWPIPPTYGSVLGHCLALFGNCLFSIKEMKSSGKLK